MDEQFKDVNKLETESTEIKIYNAIQDISRKLDDILDELRILKNK